MRAITNIETVDDFLLAVKKVPLLLAQQSGLLQAIEENATENLRYNPNEVLEEIEADLNYFKESYEKFKISHPELMV
nr:MAG TPA: hypothetical protein [Caudoviricetes sp.]